MGAYAGISAGKISELEQQFGCMLVRIRVCQKMDPRQIRDELETMLQESAEHERLLEKQTAASRLPAMEALSAVQLEYCRKADAILRQQLIQELRASNQNDMEGEAEAAALYAEYAIDLAAQAARYAMTAVFTAVEARLKAGEEQEKADHGPL